MKYSTKLSDAVHLLSYIQIIHEHGCDAGSRRITSNDLAHSIHTNPSFVRQIMMLLKKDGLLLNEQGCANPRLGRNPSEISLLDIYHAVEGSKPLLHMDTHTNPDCFVASNIQQVLKECYEQIQQAAEEKMQQISLNDIIQLFYKRLDEADRDVCQEMTSSLSDDSEI